MGASFKIAQDTLGPAGVANRSRVDGLNAGETVTLTSLDHIATFSFKFRWIPLGDTTSAASLIQASSSTYTFSPTAGIYGTWEIELRTDEGTAEEDSLVLGFAVVEAGKIRIPGPGERGNPQASLFNAGASIVKQSWINQPDAAAGFPGGIWAPWYKEFVALINQVNAATGVPGLPDTSIQFNNGGAFAGSADLTWTTATGFVGIGASGGGGIAMVGSGAAIEFQITDPGEDTKAMVQWAQAGANPGSFRAHVGGRDPNGAVTGTAGAAYFRCDSGTPANSDIYVNVDAGTTWTSLKSGSVPTQSRTFVVGAGVVPSTTAYTTFAAALAVANTLEGVTTLQSVDANIALTAVPHDFSNTVLVCANNQTSTIDLSAATATGFPPLAVGPGVQLHYNAATDFWTIASSHTMRVSGVPVTGAKALESVGAGHIFNVAAGNLNVLYDVAVLEGNVQTATGAGIVLYAFFGGGSCQSLNFPGDPTKYFLFLSDGVLLSPSFPATGFVRRVDSLLNLAVSASGPVVPNVMAHVDTSAGSFTGTLPDPTAGNEWNAGQSALFIDADLNANNNPFTIATTAGAILDLSSYSLNKEGDAAWLFPTDPLSQNSFALLTTYPRFAWEFVVDSAGASNEFSDLDAAVGVSDGYAGLKTIRMMSSETYSTARSWVGYEFQLGLGTITWDTAGSWIARPTLTGGNHEFTGAAVYTQDFTGASASMGGQLYATGHLFLGLPAGAPIQYTGDPGGTERYEAGYELALTGSVARGVFLLDANMTLIHQLSGVCTIDATAYEGAGDVHLVVEDPNSVVPSTQTHLTGTYGYSYKGSSAFVFGNDSIGAPSGVIKLSPGYSNSVAELVAGKTRQWNCNQRGYVVGMTAQHMDPVGNAVDTEFHLVVNGVLSATTITVQANDGAAQRVKFNPPVPFEATHPIEVRVTKSAPGLGDGNLETIVTLDYVVA